MVNGRYSRIIACILCNIIISLVSNSWDTDFILFSSKKSKRNFISCNLINVASNTSLITDNSNNNSPGNIDGGNQLKRAFIRNDPKLNALKTLENRNKKWLNELNNKFLKSKQNIKQASNNSVMDSKNFQSIVLIPFLSLKELNFYLDNKMSIHWLKEMNHFFQLRFVVFNRYLVHGEPNSKSKADRKKLNDNFIRNNFLEYRNVQFDTCEISPNIHINMDNANFLSQKVMLLYISECLNEALLNSNQMMNSTFTILSDSIYVDPSNLFSVMQSINGSKNDTIITMENNAIISKSHSWQLFMSELRGSFDKRTLLSIINEGLLPFFGDIKLLLQGYKSTNIKILSLNEATKSLIIAPVENETFTLGDYSFYDSSKSFLMYKQHLGLQTGINSCSLPQNISYSFSDYFTSSFKRCSFVAGIKHNYEHHAIRYLQRLSRGHDPEIDWTENQLANNKNRKCDVAIGITSRVSNFWERMQIRKTWGAIARSIGTIQVYFIYGEPETPLPPSIQDQIKPEKSIFGDLLTFPIKEGYFKMFTKVMTWFGWALENTNCDIIMKADPDTYVRIFPLMKYLHDRNILQTDLSYSTTNSKPSEVYLGLASWKAQNNKDVNHRWYFYDKWPHDFLPTFMSGAFYGLTRNLTAYVHDHREPDMRLDDPGIGAILHKLKQEQPDSFRYETSEPDWYPMMKCSRYRVFENPYFDPSASIDSTFKKDMLGKHYCYHFSASPREDLSSQDDAQFGLKLTSESTTATSNTNAPFAKFIAITSNHGIKDGKVYNLSYDSQDFINFATRSGDRIRHNAKNSVYPSNLQLLHHQYGCLTPTNAEALLIFCCSWALMIYIFFGSRKLKIGPKQKIFAPV